MKNLFEAARVKEVKEDHLLHEDLEEMVGEGLPKAALRVVVRRVFTAPRDANRLVW